MNSKPVDDKAKQSGSEKAKETVAETSKSSENKRIILNVGGIKYETYRETLTAYPDTLLGTMFHPRNQELLRPVEGTTNEFFFDRDGHAFYYIMEFYRTGTISWHPPPDPPATPKYSRHPLPKAPASPTLNQSSSSNAGTNNGTDGQCPPPPYITSLAQLESELLYFNVQQSYSKSDLSYKAGGELLDDFAYAIEELICCAIAKIVDRIAVTFYRDGTPMECPISTPGNKLRDFSVNGYCIINHFYEDIKGYLETIYPQIQFKLDFGTNYKNVTISMSYIFKRNTIRVHSKVGKVNLTENNDVINEESTYVQPAQIISRSNVKQTYELVHGIFGETFKALTNKSADELILVAKQEVELGKMTHEFDCVELKRRVEIMPHRLPPPYFSDRWSKSLKL
ncbi:556_t:CDS:2 [Paraglomus occultum]|uniref:556_t:CDS:1 n=1 Tax=Paraglomus occultum TaxID=144539 RepID=A0A9N9AX94_9GLOM|nr:556_t:CDS:2 [Paraglomus occultum]